MPHADLLKTAIEVREKAHAPYSKFKVGAAVRTADGRVFAGCNVESASFGLAICAERSALAMAVAAGARELLEVAVVADTDTPCPPCGACRQLIHDFGSKCLIIMGNLKGDERVATIAELLPGAFTDAFLHQD